MSWDICPLSGGNPFTIYPEFRKIWPVDLAIHAEEGLVELLNQPGNVETGQVFLILADGKPVGVTGYYPIVPDVKGRLSEVLEVGLVWTGVLESFRGRGAFRYILPKIAAASASRYPNAVHLVELLPATVYGMRIKPIFTAAGFQETPGLIHFDWYPSPWRKLVLDLSGFSLDVLGQSPPPGDPLVCKELQEVSRD